MSLAFVPLALLSALLVAFLAWRFVFFHRNPMRAIPSGDSLLSPADGCVLYRESVDLSVSIDPYHDRVRAVLGSRERYEVTAVYLSIFDVHLVRAPVAGRVRLFPIAPLQNENASMGLSMLYAALRRPLPAGQRSYAEKNELLGITIGEGAMARLLLVLMADWWIDQITTYVREGESVGRGQVLAKIAMGSQVDLWTVQGSYRLTCAPGERVRAGSHVLGSRCDAAPELDAAASTMRSTSASRR